MGRIWTFFSPHVFSGLFLSNSNSLGCKDQILCVIHNETGSNAHKYVFHFKNMGKKNLESIIKCRTFITDKIWIPDIFCFLETLHWCVPPIFYYISVQLALEYPMPTPLKCICKLNWYPFDPPIPIHQLDKLFDCLTKMATRNDHN